MKKHLLSRNIYFTLILTTVCYALNVNNLMLNPCFNERNNVLVYAGMFDTGKKSGSRSDSDCSCEKGEKGNKGDRGDKGEKGDKGDQGEKGDRGPGGMQGERGERGIQGIRGRPGPRGEKGEMGNQGQPGEKGEKGDKGDKGERGPSGDKGDKGDKGEQGPPGEKGYKGDKGDEGEKGMKGDAGPRGFPGVKGERGERGPRGEKGDPGLADEEVENIINRIEENTRDMRKNSGMIQLLRKETGENNLEIKILKNTGKKGQDKIKRNRVTSEKNSRRIFSIEGKNKVRDRNIQNNKERFINQAKNFKSMHVEATIGLKTGAFVLRSMTFRGNELLNLDVTGIGIIFAEKSKKVRGFRRGVDGQVLHVFNTGDFVMVLESDFILADQKIRSVAKKIEIEKDEGVTLICDGKVWRVLSVSGRSFR